MPKIIVVGLGPGSPRHVTKEALVVLNRGYPLFFRTLKHPAARYFALRLGTGRSFDRCYELGRDFEQVYRVITGKLIEAAKRHGTVVYAVPGHPLVGEATVERLSRIASGSGFDLRVVAGLSFLEPLLKSLHLDLLEGVTVLDALTLEDLKEPCRGHLVLAQVYNRPLASRVKLHLLELYPDDYPIQIVSSAGLPGERIEKTTLCALDRLSAFSHLTSLYLPPFPGKGLGDLLAIMARLRAEDGCPWDRKQTNRSLRQYLVEEAYEVLSAIDDEDDQALTDELGDVLLQVVFHSRIAEEEGRFDFYDVLNAVTGKLIRRHPHVFGSENAEDSSQVKLLWEQIKADERNLDQSSAAKKDAVLAIDHSLPALLKAYKLQKRAAEMGFDWPGIEGPLDKAREELAELEEACGKEDQPAIEEEMGDYLFTVVNIARFLKVNPEQALGKTILKFLQRFQYILDRVAETERPITDFSLYELDKWWEEAKKIKK